MVRFQTILHPTDFSEGSEPALNLACSLARDHDARLILLHVWSPPLVPLTADPVLIRPEEFSPAPFEELLEELPLPESLPHVERRLAQGGTAKEIIRVAREVPCDLIVIGTHGRTGLSRLLMGSVAENVARNAPCMVLAVKTPPPSKGAGSQPHAQAVASH